MSKKPFHCEGLFVSHSGCYVLSLPRETFRWRSHFSLLVMVFCSHIDNNYFSETSLVEQKRKMKKGTVLNADISAVISRLGHTDTLVVCDAGLPVPRSSTRIDMALTQGVPSFMQVLEVVTTEMQVEAAVIAEEIKTHNPQLHATLLTHLEQLQQHQGNTIEIRYTSHEQFKKQTADSQAVIRSGECSPFANIILCAGVTF